MFGVSSMDALRPRFEHLPQKLSKLAQQRHGFVMVSGKLTRLSAMTSTQQHSVQNYRYSATLRERAIQLYSCPRWFVALHDAA